ncbi:hypothetical protein OG762_16945 [Streptomyces sp. NBC_01136]|uniref:hypothetical protein n=1 Tax=Streptomyces sp. NBC_01136 TaxID=2903754 RepID=UPI00386FD5DA|nr:hypothetical protein OG762_16945 [Streptomyces sp. NBC_01136]
MSTLWSAEAVAAYIGAIAAAFAGALAYVQTRSTDRVARSQDEQQSNLQELRSATNTCTALNASMLTVLRALERMRSLPASFRHVQAVYEGVLLNVGRIDDALDGYDVSGSLPTGTAIADHLYSLRTRVDSLDGLIEAAGYDFSRIAALPTGWDASFAVPPGRGRTRRRLGQ